MKKTLLVLLIVVLALPAWANQQKLEKALVLLADSLARTWAEKQPGVFKLNISIGDIENNSPRAKKLQMGQTVRDLFLKIFSRSNIFSVIDRKAMQEIMKEQELQLSGITDEKSAVELGNVLNAQVILYGSVGETGDSFVISCSLVDVETGEVTTDQAIVNADIITDAAEKRLDMMYVQPMGIGLSLSAIGVNMCGNESTIIPFPEEDQTIFRRNFSLEVRYRITSWLMAAVGAEYVYGQLVHLDNVRINQSYIDLEDFGIIDPVMINLLENIGLPFNIVGQGFSVPFRISLVWSPVRWLNLSLSGGVNYNFLDFSGYFSPSNGLGFGVNDYGPTIHREFISAAVMAGVEIFVTPRLAFSVNAGYEYGVTELINDENSLLFMYLDGLDAGQDIDISGLSVAARVNLYF
ncbi:MAG: hypothetical protein JW874_09350 [Spirochaetales bacterium]|nr:hypothetical protein [Spirochaetales bacterium]